MHQPVTDNPFVIMFINMVIVFAVLTAIWGLIELTHMLDPTKKKADPPAAEPARPAAAPASAPKASASTGMSAETVAVIAQFEAAEGEGRVGRAVRKLHTERTAERESERAREEVH